MKHVKFGKQQRNVDKNWNHLKDKQKEWIVQQCKDEYVVFLNKNKRHPNKIECTEIVDNVYSLIEQKDIWIPYEEVKKVFASKLNRYRKIDIK